MVGVAQVVRAPGCGPGGRGFKSHLSPAYVAAGAQTSADRPTIFRGIARLR